MLHGLFGLLVLLVAPSLPVSVSEGDEEFARINYPEAISKYESVLQASPASADVLWRLARVHVCMGDVAEKDKREGFYRKAEQYARQCVAADEGVSEGHTWLAAALGNIAMFEGSETKVKLCNDIKRELDRAIVLKPNNDVAYSILGSFYRALGNVSWVERQLANLFLGSLPSGGYEEAETALKKAISIAPHVMRHYFELGMLYFQWDRPDDGKKAFEQAREQPIVIASDRRKLERIKETLTNLEKDSR
jgi:tetratricopeptide (TPR) repeat protein